MYSRFYLHLTWDMSGGKIDHRCSCRPTGSLIRPDIVLYDEAVNKMGEAMKVVHDADLLIILGTSLLVYPVATLPHQLRPDYPIILINYQKTPIDTRKHTYKIEEGISETLVKLNEML